jgi:DNA-binding CsgD family transcriptional regulator
MATKTRDEVTLSEPEVPQDWVPTNPIPATHVAKLMASVDDADALAGALLEALEALAPVRHVDVGVFARKPTPLQFWFSPPHADVAIYQSVVPDLDPMTVAIRRGDHGLLSLRDVAPRGFERSALYKEIYAGHGIIDELVHTPGRTHGLWVVSHVSKSERFSEAEVRRHEAAHPVVHASLLRLAHLLARTESPSRPGDEVVPVDSALERFGADVLTHKEQEVVHLILRGHDTESVSHQLGIAWNTVRGHRARAYRKLGVTSQGELFYQFLQTLGLPDD